MINTKMIKDSDLFQKTLTNGKWYGGSFICMYVTKNNQNINQIGLAIGKKVGKAYRRNQVKRFIKEAYTTLENELSIGYNMVFVWKSSANYDEVSFSLIHKDLEKMLKKAEILP